MRGWVVGVASVMRMQGQAIVPGVGDDGGRPPYAYPGGNADLWARDEQLGKIFRDMRQAMRVSRETIARRLATNSATIESFETGAVASLPNWKETGRIVRTYCDLLRVDPEPILGHIRGRLQTIANEAKAARVATPIEFTSGRTSPRSIPTTRSVRTAPTVHAQTRPPRRRRRRTRVLFALSAPLALVAAVFYLAQATPQPVYAAINFLPDSAEIAVRAGVDYLMLLSAPRRDGLRWIEVSDPRARKADKLQQQAAR
jgi:hypothetical protein